MFKSEKQKHTSILVFSIYMFFLIWIIVFKLCTNFDDLTPMRNINLVPFNYQKSLHGWAFKELAYNILLFVPFGVYVELFLEKKSIILKSISGFFLSLLFEVVQYIFAIGSSDITDLIANTLGTVIGIVICLILQKIFKKNTATVVNVTGQACVVIAVVLGVLVAVANL